MARVARCSVSQRPERGSPSCTRTSCSVGTCRSRYRNAETAEPSEWELMERYLSWTVVTIMLLVLYLVGLRA